MNEERGRETGLNRVVGRWCVHEPGVGNKREGREGRERRRREKRGSLVFASYDSYADCERRRYIIVKSTSL